MNKIKLYIVKQNESINDIALKFNTTPEEIVRINPSLKYKRMYKGQPLNILCEEEKEREKLEIEPIESLRKHSDQISTNLFTDYSYALKDVLQIKFLYHKALEPFAEYLNEITLNIKNRVKVNFEKFNKEILSLTDSIITKDILQLKSSLSSINAAIVEAFKSKKNDSDYSSMLDDLCDLWRDITIALGELDFKVVLNKFKEVLRVFSNITEKI